MPTLALAINARGAKVGAREFQVAANTVKGAASTAAARVAVMDRGVNRLAASTALLRGTVFGLLGTIGGIIALKSAITIIAQFEETMATVKGVTGATREEFEMFNKQARILGATTRFSARQAAEGQLFLGRAGFEANEIIAALPATLDLAQSGQLELGRASEIAANAIRQFGLNADEARRVSDVFVMTANSANTDVEQLAQAMKFAGPVAGALGLQIEEVSAAIGVLGNAGIQGSLAGTNLRGMMAALLGPTTKARDAMKEMNITSAQVTPAFNTLTDIVQVFADKEISAAQAVEIFGRRNAAAILVLSRNVETMKKLNVANQEAAGVAKLLAEIQDDTLVGSFKALISVVQEAMLAMGRSGLTMVVRVLVDTVTGAMRILLGMEDSIAHVTPAMRAMAVTLKVLGIGFGALVAMKLGLFFANVAIGLLQVAFNAKTASFALKGILPVAAAIIVAFTSFSLGSWIYDEFRWVQEILAKGIQWVMNAWSTLTIGLRIVWNEFSNFLRKSLEGITDWMADWLFNVADLVDLFDSKWAREMKVKAAKLDFAVEPTILSSEEMNQKLLDLTAEWRTDLEANAEIFKLTMDDIASEFGDTTRKGTSLADELVTNFDSIANKVKSVFPEVELQLQSAKESMIEFFGTAEYAEKSEALQARLDALNAKIAGLTENIEGQRLSIEDEVNAVRDLDKETEKLNETLGSGLANSVGDAFGSLQRGAADSSNLVQNLIQDVLQLITQLLVIKPLVSGLTNVFSGGLSGLFGQSGGDGWKGVPFTAPARMGRAYNQGQVIPFASGAVFNGPTTFPMSQGRTGLMGEAGPEAVLPLARVGGKLGVETSGRGTIVNVHMSGVQDFDSFARSNGQMTNMLQRSMRRANKVG